MENQNQQAYQANDVKKQAAPYSISAMILGIASIVSCAIYGAGIVLGIIALLHTKKANAFMLNNPDAFTPSSLKMVKAGKICGIIGIILSVLMLILIVFIFSRIFSHFPNYHNHSLN